MRITAIAFILGALFVSKAEAVPFTNQFIEFELPPEWSCTLEGAEWVCQSADNNKKRDAIIILAAKLKGDQDSLDQYEAYLKQPKKYTSIQNRPVQSEPKDTKQAKINDHAWIDSLHLESEIPGFYTRYLATIKQDIAVLVTYSINKDKFSDYQKALDDMAKTIKVFRKSGVGLNAASKDSNLFNSINVPSQISQSTIFGTAQPENRPAGSSGSGEGSGSSGDTENMLFLVGAVAVVLFIIMRRRRG